VISAGMVMNILLRYRRGEWGRLLFDIRGVAGLLLYWLAVVLAWAGLSGRGAPFPPALSALLVALLLSAILFSGPLTRRLFRQEGEGEGVVVHLFHVFHGLLSFLSNTVSFVRLAAFALNHVGLSVAVLMLSTMVEGIPGGGVLAWVILVAGHLVIVALEGLIVFIQALRLEYYELFSKFYSGGGTPFAPVRWGGGRG
ncbi:MAG: ATPase, partial [Synergistales bacterium]|nr:ATPase [Synergistales bacterium]